MKNLSFLLLLGLIIMACNNTTPEVENIKTPERPENYYTEPHRPQFHFTPEKKWMNDPNGMVYYQGEYHLFYQYYPDSTIWGPMHWGHAISEDLVKWKHLPIGLYPDSMGYIFSGSAVVDWNNTSGFGEGEKPPLVAVYTLGVEDHKKIPQRQGVAWSNDNGRTWEKYKDNPVIDENLRAFRDPKIFWHDPSRQWIMAVVASNSNEDIIPDHVRFYASANLKDWKFLSDFGYTYGKQGGKWECPDLFPMRINGNGEKKWVLLVSIDPGSPNGGSGTQYFVGDFDGKNFTLDPAFLKDVENGQAVWLDWGRDNYAGVTWADIPEADGRRLFMGWMSNWQYAQVVPTGVWRSAMTLPRVLRLGQTAQGLRLFSRPLEELEELRGLTFSLSEEKVEGDLDLTDKLGFPPSSMEILMDIEVSDDANFGIELSNAKGETYQVGFDAANQQFYSDRTNAGPAGFSDQFASEIHTAPRINPGATLRLHVFFDVASCELFADWGATTMTDTFFPGEDFNQIKLYAKNGSVKINAGRFFQMERIW